MLLEMAVYDRFSKGRNRSGLQMPIVRILEFVSLWDDDRTSSKFHIDTLNIELSLQV